MPLCLCGRGCGAALTEDKTSTRRRDRKDCCTVDGKCMVTARACVRFTLVVINFVYRRLCRLVQTDITQYNDSTVNLCAIRHDTIAVLLYIITFYRTTRNTFSTNPSNHRRRRRTAFTDSGLFNNGFFYFSFFSVIVFSSIRVVD